MSTMELCVGKTYGEIWQIYKAKHGDNPDTHYIHLKWKKLGTAAANGTL